MAHLFVDANVFLYAVGGESPFRTSCREFLKAAGDGVVDAVTNTEVLQEILHVRSRRAGIQDAIEATRAAANLVSDVLPVAREDIQLACLLLESHAGIGTRDALHAAVMKNAAIHLIVSVDRDFDVFKDLKRLGPDEALSLAG